MQKWFVFLLSCLFSFNAFSQNEWSIYGAIKDTLGLPIDMVSIKTIEGKFSTLSNRNGFFKLTFNENRDYHILFSKLNYSTKELVLNTKMSDKSIDIVLEMSEIRIKEVLVSDQKIRENGLIRIESKLLNNIPNITGDNIQALIKTMPGVASGNELSSNYSVRGGNFDENLVYINGIEIFRPALLQSGQQEGLNMANPDLVSKIDFSSGGFSAIYEDKMSSVLDIKYKQPDEFKAGTSLSLLGASAYVEGSHFNKKFSHISGFRYKNAQYLLKSLETNGEYRPNFVDFQTSLTYNISKTLSLSLLGYYANNNFLFYPEDRSTSFGTINEVLNLYIDFDGKENDNFTSSLGAFTINYRLTDKAGLKLTSAIYRNDESLTYDIAGRYSINQLDKQLGSSTFGDSILNLGIGSFINHARSYYTADVYNVQHTGWWQFGNNFIQWGVKYQHELFNDKVNEWKMVDSAGYSIPYANQQINLAERWYSDNNLSSNHFSSFIRSTFQNPGSLDWNLDYGIRYSISDLNKENLISPRISIGWYPKHQKKFYLRLGSGIYYQAIVFREIIDRYGKVYPKTKTPFSIHYIASGDYDFIMMDRPFHIKTELYYKDLKRLIPYSVDNIRNIYYPGKTAQGYAGGIDFRINGEFVKEVESWLSVSLMKSGIRIDGDTIGTQPLPNDHLLNISLFFQDYIPGNKRFKMNLALYYLSGKPFGPPNNDSYYAPLRIVSYKRVDIGFSIDLFPAKKHDELSGKRLFKQALLNFEVFNLIDINNTVSYNWVTVVPNSSVAGNDQYSSFAVPNRLSARRLNLRLILSF